MSRSPGGYIGFNRVPASAAANSAASGVWTVREAESLKRAGTWPTAPAAGPTLTRITNGTNGSFTGTGTAADPFVAASYFGGFGSSVRFQVSGSGTIQVRYNATNDGDDYLQFGFYTDAGGTLYSFGGGNGAGTDRVVSFAVTANAIFRVTVDNAGSFTNLRIWATA